MSGEKETEKQINEPSGPQPADSAYDKFSGFKV